MVLKWREVADCPKCVKQQQETPYHRRWTAALAVRRSADVDDDLSLCLQLMSAMHVEVRHRDIPVPGYSDSGRRGPTVCTRHAVVLATSAGCEQVALRSWTSVSRRSDVQQRSRQTAACQSCSLMNQLTWRCHSPVVTRPRRWSAISVFDNTYFFIFQKPTNFKDFETTCQKLVSENSVFTPSTVRSQLKTRVRMSNS